MRQPIQLTKTNPSIHHSISRSCLGLVCFLLALGLAATYVTLAPAARAVTQSDPCPDCPKLQWETIPFAGAILGTGNSATLVEPALLVSNGIAYLAVVSVYGQVYVYERSVTEQIGFVGPSLTCPGDPVYGSWSYTQNWGDWVQVPIIPPLGLSFEYLTPPVFVQRIDPNPMVCLFARGSNNNLYVTCKNPASPLGTGWSDWTSITDDESVIGRIDAAATGDPDPPYSDELHVVYHSNTGGLTRLILRDGISDIDRFDYVFNAPSGSGFTPSVASDKQNIAALVFTEVGSLTGPKFLVFNRDSNFEEAVIAEGQPDRPMFEGAKWTGKSDLTYLTGNSRFHALLGLSTPDGTVSYEHYAILVPDNQIQYFAWNSIFFNRRIPTPAHVYYRALGPSQRAALDIQPSIIDYRHKLLISYVEPWSEPGDNLQFRRWDNTDQAQGNPWVTEHAQSMETGVRPSLCSDKNEIYAAVRTPNGEIRFILLSRSLSVYRILDQNLSVQYPDVVTADGTPGEDGVPDPGGFLKPAWELPSTTEIGFGTWTTPEWMTGHLIRDYIKAGDLGTYYIWIHAVRNNCNAYFDNGLHIEPDMGYSSFLEEYFHKIQHALALSLVCSESSTEPRYGCAYEEDLEPHIPTSAIETGRLLFSTNIGCCFGDPARAPGFLGVGVGSQENYDSTTDEHSFIYMLLWYFTKPAQTRSLIQTDISNGDFLLRDKYNWVKWWIFRGVEFDDENSILVN